MLQKKTFSNLWLCAKDSSSIEAEMRSWVGVVLEYCVQFSWSCFRRFEILDSSKQAIKIFRVLEKQANLWFMLSMSAPCWRKHWEVTDSFWIAAYTWKRKDRYGLWIFLLFPLPEVLVTSHSWSWGSDSWTDAIKCYLNAWQALLVLTYKNGRCL